MEDVTGLSAAPSNTKKATSKRRKAQSEGSKKTRKLDTGKVDTSSPPIPDQGLVSDLTYPPASEVTETSPVTVVSELHTKEFTSEEITCTNDNVSPVDIFYDANCATQDVEVKLERIVQDPVIVPTTTRKKEEVMPPPKPGKAPSVFLCTCHANFFGNNEGALLVVEENQSKAQVAVKSWEKKHNFLSKNTPILLPVIPRRKGCIIFRNGKILYEITFEDFENPSQICIEDLHIFVSRDVSANVSDIAGAIIFAPNENSAKKMLKAVVRSKVPCSNPIQYTQDCISNTTKFELDAIKWVHNVCTLSDLLLG